MGFYLGYAITLLGRPQDSLSHVLVSAPFESHPGFYYPTQESQVIFTPPPDSRPLDTSRAEIWVAEIPFVRLRSWLPATLGEVRSYRETVEAMRQTLEPPARVTINLKERTIEVGGVKSHLPPAELAFYAWLARRRQQGKPAVSCPCDGAPERSYSDEFLQEYRRIRKGLDPTDRTERALKEGMEKAYFLERVSRLNKRLCQAFDRLGPRLFVRAQGQRPHTTYEVALDPSCIHFLPSEDDDR